MESPLAANAGSASAWYAFAGQKLATGDVDGAISAYSQSLKLEPRNAAALNNLGAALIKACRFQEAISTLESALLLQPGYQRAVANLGKALREAGYLVEAIARLRDALVREPHQVSALVNLGDALAATGELDAGPDAFLDTAAALKCVDLLVTSDTAIAHLSGALGVPTWLCLMHEPDWRWMGQGSRTPWYESVRLFHQPTPGDWASVYAEVAGKLAARSSERCRRCRSVSRPAE
jgi:tetratricopeptide (TPR) repeat protein